MALIGPCQSSGVRLALVTCLKQLYYSNAWEPLAMIPSLSPRGARDCKYDIRILRTQMYSPEVNVILALLIRCSRQQDISRLIFSCSPRLSAAVFFPMVPFRGMLFSLLGRDDKTSSTVLVRKRLRKPYLSIDLPRVSSFLGMTIVPGENSNSGPNSKNKPHM